MKISPEQMAFLMSEEREADIVMCVHDVEIHHIHSGISDIPPAYVARFAGHMDYEDANPDTHPDTEYPADQLVTVDVYFSPRRLLALMAEVANEQLAAAECVRLVEHEAPAVDMGTLVDEFIEKLNGEETDNNDD